MWESVKNGGKSLIGSGGLHKKYMYVHAHLVLSTWIPERHKQVHSDRPKKSVLDGHLVFTAFTFFVCAIDIV